MRLIFAGTPAFAAAALATLTDAGHDIAVVLTQPDRPAGRGLRMTASAVKQLAHLRGLQVAQPQTLRDPAAQAMLAALAPEAMVVAAYGLLLPPEVLTIPSRGCLNIHASLLPRWRGAAPVQRALLAGDIETGVSIMQMDAGLDTGPVWRRSALLIDPTDTAGSLLDRLARLGARMIADTLASLDQPGGPEAQPAGGVTYAHKINKREAAIDFSQSASQIERQIRAFDPVPGAFCLIGGQLLKVWSARCEALSEVRSGVRSEACAHIHSPGQIIEIDDQRGIGVACGEGVLWLHSLQRAGGRRQDALAFARAHPALAIGSRLDPGTGVVDGATG